MFRHFMVDVDNRHPKTMKETNFYPFSEKYCVRNLIFEFPCFVVCISKYLEWQIGKGIPHHLQMFQHVSTTAPFFLWIKSLFTIFETSFWTAKRHIFCYHNSLSWRVSPVWWCFTRLMVPLRTCIDAFCRFFSQLEISKRFGRIASNRTCNLVLNERFLWFVIPAGFLFEKDCWRKGKSIFNIHRHSFCSKSCSCWAHPCLRRTVELFLFIPLQDVCLGCHSLEKNANSSLSWVIGCTQNLEYAKGLVRHKFHH